MQNQPARRVGESSQGTLYSHNFVATVNDSLGLVLLMWKKEKRYGKKVIRSKIRKVHRSEDVRGFIQSRGRHCYWSDVGGDETSDCLESSPHRLIIDPGMHAEIAPYALIIMSLILPSEYKYVLGRAS